MRVISQDGTLDIPYEGHIFGASTEKNCIIAVRFRKPCPCMAWYSTQEKAVKALKMMREARRNGCVVFQFPKDDEV